MIEHKCDGCKYRGEHQEMGFKPFGVCYKAANLIEAERNYYAETCPYKSPLPQLYETDPEPEELPEPEQWPKENPYLKPAVKISADFAPLIKGVGKIAAAFFTMIRALEGHLPILSNTLANIQETFINAYPNKRVIYLATHGKRRTRKKNINRILKYFEREAKKPPAIRHH